MNRHTSNLRRLVLPKRRRVVALTGGKGGVGRSTLAVNLAIAYAQLGSRTLLVDGDAGMADLNLQLGIAPGKTLIDLLHGAEIDEVLVGVYGLSVLPGQSGSSLSANLDRPHRELLLEKLVSLSDRFETLILDTAAGISDTTVDLAGAAADVVCVATPEPLSIANAYACLKALVYRTGLQRAFLLANAVHAQAEADELYARLAALVERFLGIDLIALPAVPFDSALRIASAQGRPLQASTPDAPASQAIARVARFLDQRASASTSRGTLDRWLEAV